MQCKSRLRDGAKHKKNSGAVSLIMVTKLLKQDIMRDMKAALYIAIVQRTASAALQHLVCNCV